VEESYTANGVTLSGAVAMMISKPEESTIEADGICAELLLLAELLELLEEPKLNRRLLKELVMQIGAIHVQGCPSVDIVQQ
jgi:hypothetical protein